MLSDLVAAVIDLLLMRIRTLKYALVPAHPDRESLDIARTR
jgi:hypothetical protein